MSFISRIIARITPLKYRHLNAKTINYGEYFIWTDYIETYSQLLRGISSEQVMLSELYLFRAWTTYFGFGIFNNRVVPVDEIACEVVNLSKYFGLPLFIQRHGFNPEVVLDGPFISILDERWQSYDEIVIQAGPGLNIPSSNLVDAVLLRCGVSISDDPYPEKLLLLGNEFNRHLTQIKYEASRLGLLT